MTLRRVFLLACSLFRACFFLTSVLASAAAAKPPNIVFIFSDDHAYQAISAYGDPRHLIDTPQIDRIAKEGMRFDRCLVPNPICGPSRACVQTGKYSHINGFPNNTNSFFNNGQVTFPKLLQQAGYQTAIVGKWHLEADPKGFDFWQILYGQGIYYNPPMNQMGKRVKTDGYVTDIITDTSLKWLDSRDKSKPFLLMCQQKAPHRTWEPAVRDLNFDHDRKYPEPATLLDNYEGRGVAEKNQEMTLLEAINSKDMKLDGPPAGLSPEQASAWDSYYKPRNDAFLKANLQGDDLVRWRYQRYLHDYLACVKEVDVSVGKVLDYLEKNGLAEDTIVVYSSDQGFYLGEHGWFDKRWIFEESLRTPLLVRWPGQVKPGSVCKEIVSNVDFAETLLDVAGAPVPAEMQGRSFVPLLQGKTPDDWRKSFYFQYFEFPMPHHVEPHYGVVTDRYKLMHFTGGTKGVDYWELFDREKDPQELKSFFGLPEYATVQADLAKEVERLRKELKVPEQIPAEYYGKPGTGWTKGSAGK